VSKDRWRDSKRAGRASVHSCPRWRDSKRAGRASVHSCLPLHCCLETRKYPQLCLVTLPRFREKNQSAADIRARHQYISGLQSDTKGSLPFYFVLKKNSSLPCTQQPTGGFWSEAGECTANTFTTWFINGSWYYL